MGQNYPLVSVSKQEKARFLKSKIQTAEALGNNILYNLYFRLLHGSRIGEPS